MSRGGTLAFTETNGYWMHYEVFGDESALALALMHGGLGGGGGSHNTINQQESAPRGLLIVR